MSKEKRLEMARKSFNTSRTIFKTSEIKKSKNYSDMNSFEKSIQTLKESAKKGAKIINGAWGDAY